MMALLQRTMAAVAMLAAVLSGCSAGSIGDSLPQSMGGLPAGAPARPNTANRQFPGVNDLPAPRATQPMSEEEQVKVEKDLQGLRDRQNAATKDDTAQPAAPAAKPAPKAASKKQSDAKTSGAKANP